jgi:hypothetical protein
MPATQQHAIELLDLVPDLPSPTQRWTVARKNTVIRAVRGSWVPIEEVCERYGISVDEFLAWSGTSTATVSQVCARRDYRSTATPKKGGDSRPCQRSPPMRWRYSWGLRFSGS